MSTMAHEVCCPICKALPMDCRCSLESLLKRAGRGYLGQSASGPQQTMTSLREMRESLAALVTEVRGLREDQQRMNGLLLERLSHNADSLHSTMHHHAQMLHNRVEVYSSAWDKLIADDRESAIRNHCQVMKALQSIAKSVRTTRRGKRRK